MFRIKITDSKVIDRAMHKAGLHFKDKIIQIDFDD
jgi:hypothetical protein